MPEIKNRRKNKSSNLNTTYVYLKAQLIFLLMYSAVFVIISLICLTADINKSYDYYISLALFSCSSFIAGYYGGFLQKSKGLFAGILYALPLNIILLLISLIITHLKTDMNIFITAVILVVFSGIGGILSVNKRRRR